MKKLISFVAALAVVAVALPLASSAAVIGSVSFNANPVNQGQTVTLTGACGSTNANGTVNLTVTNGSTVQTAAVTANASGDFTSSISVSETFPLGSAAVVATCANGDTVTGTLTINEPIGETLTVSGTATLGQSLTVSGDCGTVSSGSTVNLALERNNVSTSIGSTTTTDASGSFSSSFTIPSTYGGGLATIVASCPNGEIEFSTAIVDPFANVIVGSTTPNAGSTLTVSGTCGTTAGATVTFTLTPSAGANATLGTTSTVANGAFSTVLNIPSTTATGNATLVAFCPSGNVATAGLNIQAVVPPVTPPVVVDPVEDEFPVGGVAAGEGRSVLDLFAWILMGLGTGGLIATRVANVKRTNE